MLAISLLWASELTRNQPSCLAPSAYADNWTWTSTDEALHEHAVRSTLETVSLCGLKIDWNKTWLFATDTRAASQAKSAMQVVLGEREVSRVHHEKDLGFELRYSGQHRLGHRSQRYEKGLQRLQRLTFLHADPQEKEKLWNVSIFPQAFYGAEICPPGDDVVKKFRSKAADAIFGVSQSMSPGIALLLGIRGILDPGYKLILNP